MTIRNLLVLRAERFARVLAATVFVAVAAFPFAQHSELRTQSQAIQTPELRFEAASIKPNKKSVEERMLSATPAGIFTLPGGRFQSSQLTVLALIVRAFGVQAYQVEGAASWLSQEVFDIDATAGRDATAAEMNEMLKALLIDRLQFRAHIETRPAPSYALTLARTDGQLGTGLRPTNGCGSSSGATPPLSLTVDTPPVCGTRNGRGPLGGRRIMIGGGTIAILATMLRSEFDGPLEDRTGLTGRFNVVLEFQSTAMESPGGRLVFSEPSAAPALREALTTQLGLKLEKATAPMAYVVIDSIERPSPD